MTYNTTEDSGKFESTGGRGTRYLSFDLAGTRSDRLPHEDVVRTWLLIRNCSQHQRKASHVLLCVVSFDFDTAEKKSSSSILETNEVKSRSTRGSRERKILVESKTTTPPNLMIFKINMKLVQRLAWSMSIISKHHYVDME
eukprot:TRINITY_DN661_c0_g2_i1.p1 TRINITY_DN661_c0_g2~~TRINITY_DN661_c0_g2_i1.p1  ORF type:complete len:141 (+),score=9.99 TRINITY_DN661_c0_g2_i1:139-561(+)